MGVEMFDYDVIWDTIGPLSILGGIAGTLFISGMFYIIIAVGRTKIGQIFLFSALAFTAANVAVYSYAVSQVHLDDNRAAIQSHYDITLPAGVQVHRSIDSLGPVKHVDVDFAAGQNLGDIDDLPAKDVQQGVVRIEGTHAVLTVSDGQGGQIEYASGQNDH